MIKRTLLSFLTFFSLVSISAQDDLWYGATYVDSNGLVYEYMHQSAPYTQYVGFFVMSPNIGYGVDTNVNNNLINGNVVIPDSIPFEVSEGKIEKFSVVGIYSFGGCTDLTSVVIPEGIKCINAYAFQGCTGLTSITIPSTVGYIGEEAFEGCAGLESVTFVKGERVHLSIEHDAFAGCTSIKSIYLHSNISVVYNPFVNCSSLESITVDPENKYIDSRYDCNAIISRVTDYNGNNEHFRLISGCKNTVIPSDVVEIGQNAFLGSGIVSLSIPSSVTNIESSAFGNCKSLESITVDPGNKAYDSRDNCNAIIEKTDSIGYYGDKLRFKDRLIVGCKNTSIPPTVTTIGESAFLGCSGLESIYIPALVTNITSGCFYGTGLKSIVVDPDNAVYDSRNGCNAIIGKQDNILYVGCKNTDIPEGVLSIGKFAFSGCKGLDSVVIPEGVQTIETGAFESSDIVSVTIPKSVRRISGYSYYYGAFSGCTNLSSVVFDSESELDTIGCRTFSRCSSLKSITIPKSVSIIDRYAFSDCLGLTSIVIPENVLKIGECAFQGCRNLKSMTMLIPDPNNHYYLDEYGAITDIARVSIDRSAFDFNFNTPYNEECILYVPKGKYIIYRNHSAFMGFLDIKMMLDENSKSVNGINYEIRNDTDGVYAAVVYGYYEGDIVIPPSVVIEDVSYPVKVISVYAFSGCRKVTSIEMPESLTRLGEYDYEGFCFEDCSGLTSLKIPSGVTDIAAGTFMGCSSLESIVLPDGINNIGRATFLGCSSLKSVVLPDGVNIIGKEAFSGCSSIEAIVIPSGVKAIEDNTFEKCYNLNYVTIPLGIESIGEYAFSYCTSLTNITIPEGNTIIGKMAFWGCEKLTTINLPSSLDSIGYDAFKRCNINTLYWNSNDMLGAIKEQLGANITNVILGDNVTRISENAFSGFENLASIVISSSVKSISANAFKKCNELSSVLVPASVEKIEENAFYGCASLKDVVIEGAPEIGHNAFWNCPNIETVTSLSVIPGKMNSYDKPQIILAGDCNGIAAENPELSVTPIYNDELGRTVSEIDSKILSWSCSIRTDDVIPGTYQVVVGILPNSNGLPCYFHPAIMGGKEDSSVLDLIYEPKQKKGPRYIPRSYTNNISEYDSIVVADTLTIPEGYDYLVIYLISNVTEMTLPKYSTKLVLDRIFFKPLGDNLPVESYAGPFVQNVFNNAMLYVPYSAVDAYRAADGWKLFKNIATDTAVDPVRKDNRNNTGIPVIFDIFGRKVSSDSLEGLQPGLYIINGNKYLKM